VTPIHVTDHALDRWWERADHSSVAGPQIAWHLADTITAPHGLDGDEVRYHAPSETVLVRRDGSIVTIIDATDGVKPRLRAALAAVRGGDRA
jgi:hypothetical protein